ncbi:conserved hypothetical protein [Culex quinquefasciatus]|uniref:Ig-like domain-containing protein n=1 Tax=Culex quinquefasciatus TaxID=7176 RepID=B0WE61_CULQU|nr:conserved hypothetical protein [Culex quinquefasciatus]|eukprot:XP_001846995.1 conserved hypothetical protein [Culex quinquefasciatus]
MEAHDPPVVTLQLGSTLSIDDIKEGDDIYFECKIQSNPAWRRLSWLHNQTCATASGPEPATARLRYAASRRTRSAGQSRSAVPLLLEFVGAPGCRRPPGCVRSESWQ